MPTIRVKHRPDLGVILSPTGLEAYTDKRGRIDELIRQGVKEELMGGTPFELNQHGGVVHQVSGTVGVGSDSAMVDPTQEEAPAEDDQ